MSPRAAGRAPGADAYRGAKLPAGGAPWIRARFCAVDLELSGLDPRRDEILSFGAVPIDAGRILLGAAIEGLVRPAGEISESSIRVHGLRAADLEHASPLDEAIDPLLAAMAGAVPVVHSAAVERAFLTPALRRQGLRLRRPMVDTAVLGLVWLHERDGRGPRHITLARLAEELCLPSHHPHDAVGDALTTAQAFIALAAKLDAIAPESVRSLTRASRRLQALQTFSVP
jgi:DNA polymerase-3 subunit epsilon